MNEPKTIAIIDLGNGQGVDVTEVPSNASAPFQVSVQDDYEHASINVTRDQLVAFARAVLGAMGENP